MRTCSPQFDRDFSMLIFLTLTFFFLGSSCENLERLVVPQGQPFAFDCHHDESVYFAKKLNQWTEIHHGDFDLSFEYLTNDKLLRVKAEAAQSKHVGFFACRKTTWTSTAMNVIYQLILADIQSFYWNFVCHGPTGSCKRTDDYFDSSLSTFEIPEQMSVEFFCCASVIGYDDVNIQMNRLGEYQSNVEIERRKDVDGATILCAQQRTKFTLLMFPSPPKLVCELVGTQQKYSTLSSSIIITESVIPERFRYPLWNSNPNPYPETPPNIPMFFPRPAIDPDMRKHYRRRRWIIIIGSFLSGCALCGLFCCAIFWFCCCRKTDSMSFPTTKTKVYRPVNISEQRVYENQRAPSDPPPLYEEAH